MNSEEISAIQQLRFPVVTKRTVSTTLASIIVLIGLKRISELNRFIRKTF